MFNIEKLTREEKIELLLELLKYCPIIEVKAKNVDRKYHLGFAVGDFHDIEAYFDEQKAYGLEIKAIHTLVIPKGFADRKKNLLNQKVVLEKQLANIEKQIKEPK